MLLTNLEKHQNKIFIAIPIIIIVIVLLVVFSKKAKASTPNILDNHKYIFGNKEDYKTWDKYTNERITKLHPKLRKTVELFILKCQRDGMNVRLASGLRTFAEQEALYSQGRTDKSKSIVTNAKAGRSYHNYGLAVDVYEIKNGAIYEGNRNKIALIGKKNGFEWGGDWKKFIDRPHFQMTFGKNINKLETSYKNGTFDKNGYVKI